MSELSLELHRFASAIAADGNDLSEFIDVEDPTVGMPTLPRFYVLVGAVLEAQHKHLDANKLGFEYSESFPEKDDNVTKPRITYSLKSRKYASHGGGRLGGAMNAGVVRSYKPVLRGETKLSGNIGAVLAHESVAFDNIVRLKVTSRTNKVATRVALWIEDTIRRFSPIFEKAGYQVHFIEQKEDGVDTTANRKAPTRCLEYFVRTQTITTSLASIINCIELTVGATNE